MVFFTTFFYLKNSTEDCFLFYIEALAKFRNISFSIGCESGDGVLKTSLHAF